MKNAKLWINHACILQKRLILAVFVDLFSRYYLSNH